MADFYTPIEDLPDLVARAHDKYRSGATKSLAWRRRQIEGIQRMVKENAAELERALVVDLKATHWWAKEVELAGTLAECHDALENLEAWTAPRPVGNPLVLLPASSWLQPEPYGTILIVAPWNYPQNLLLMPLVAALAAGNTAVVKPSEISEASARILGELLPRYVDEDAVVVVQGAAEETQALLKEKFDMIVYTGSGAVAKHYLRAAAEHLTPCLLELGGKCPAIVAPDANMNQAAKKIVWGKWSLNHGQSCLSPDYILTTPEAEPKILAEVKKVLKEFYSDDPKSSSEVSRIVNERHTKRVAELLDDDAIEILVGGEVDVADRYVAPTVVRAPAYDESKVMAGEIFGPILPIVVVDSMDEAVEYVNRPEHGKPLGLYVFSSSSAVSKYVVDNTSSGAAIINDCAVHARNHELPFGGVGGSGMGSYHGKYGFDACSHMKACLKKIGSDPPIRFPPYTPGKMKIFEVLGMLQAHQKLLKNVGIGGAVLAALGVAWYNGYLSSLGV